MGELVDALAAADDATNGWVTPTEYLTTLGPFDLDPCAHSDDQWPAELVARCIARPDDGLTAPWVGLVWLNPPYTDVGRWVARLSGHGDGIALIFARTETAWFAEYVWAKASALLFIEGRVSFRRALSPQRKGHNAPAPSVLVAYGETAAARLAACDISGAHVLRWSKIPATTAAEGLW